MSDRFDDLAAFLECCFAGKADHDEKEILEALIWWVEHGSPPLSITVTYHADGSATVDRYQDRDVVG